MDANGSSAKRARPSYFFVLQEFSNSHLFHFFKVFDCTHVVSGSISFIHLFDSRTGEFLTLETKSQFIFVQFIAVFDFT